MKHVDTVVVGGGISGLSTAWFLKNSGTSPLVLEKRSRPGGVIRTRSMDGFLFEHGPNSIMETSGPLTEILEGLGLKDRLVSASENAKNRFVVREGTLQKIPTGFLEFLSSGILSASGKLRLLCEPFVSRADSGREESIASFVERRLGLEALDYLVNPFVAGVYAGRPGELSVRHCFERLWRMEQEYGSVVWGAIKSGFSGDGEQEDMETHENSDGNASGMLSFREGLQELPEALKKDLGECFRSETEVIRIEEAGNPRDQNYTVHLDSPGGELDVVHADRIVLCVPGNQASRLLQPLCGSELKTLEDISYAPVAVVFFGYRRWPLEKSLNGFGFLVPRVEHRNILGTLWNSSIFPDRAPEGGEAMTTFVGGTRQPELLKKTDHEIVRIVREELKDIVGVKKRPDVVRVKRWKKAIPQYIVGHGKILDAIEEVEKSYPGIFVRGNYRDGVSVPDRIRSGKKTARRVQA